MITIKDTNIKFIRFKKILLVSEQKITVLLDHQQCSIVGSHLTITYLSAFEMWISGKIDRMDFLYEEE